MKLPGKNEVDLRLQRTRLQKERKLLVEQLKKENRVLASLLEPTLNGYPTNTPLSEHISNRMGNRYQTHESMIPQLAESSLEEIKQFLVQVSQ